MNAALLDVNVLLAMAWPSHGGHGAAQRWLEREGRKGWASCPFTQSGFVRIICNPAFSRDALSPAQAIALLSDNLEHPGHQFWPAAITVNEALLNVGMIVGHQQVTDAYLLGLAIHNKGRLVTLDHRALSLLSRDDPRRRQVEVIG